MRLDSEGIIIEIIVRESSGSKIESHKVRVKDKHKTNSLLYMLKKKYGFNDFPKKDKDIDWLKQKDNW
jgi:hypothetical protein